MLKASCFAAKATAKMNVDATEHPKDNLIAILLCGNIRTRNHETKQSFSAARNKDEFFISICLDRRQKNIYNTLEVKMQTALQE